jgi:holin-like protein
VKWFRAIVQIAVLSLLYVGSDAAARALRSPVPGSVIGAVVLAALLLAGAIPLRWVEDGADLLLKYLALFFVPSAVAAARVWGDVRNDVLVIALVSVVTTILVLVCTAKLAAHWEDR